MSASWRIPGPTAATRRHKRATLPSWLAVLTLGLGPGLVAQPGLAADDRAFELVLQDDALSRPDRTLSATRGEVVSIVVRADEAVTLHLHGYDRELEVPAGGEATLRLEADLAGRFPVESHAAHGHDTIFYLEIQPD